MSSSVSFGFPSTLFSESKMDGKPKLTDDDIYGTCITFLFAGYETTSNALAYTAYLLALHPEIQERLYQEVKDVIKGKEVYEVLVICTFHCNCCIESGFARD